MNREEVLAKYELDKDLSEANLRKANLRKADLSKANLSEADLREADLSEANLSEANLRKAIVDLSILTARNVPAYISSQAIGSRNAISIFFPAFDTINCGCWVGTLEAFEARVKEVYPVDNKHFKDYMVFIQECKEAK